MKTRCFYVLDVEKGQILFRRTSKGSIFEFWTISDGYGHMFYQVGMHIKSVERAKQFALKANEVGYFYWESDFDENLNHDFKWSGRI